jgi:hypothetical protein
MTGNAAHIHGAAPGPGSRRYLESMTPEERSDISNAIWLCAYHADLIDKDEVTYTADVRGRSFCRARVATQVEPGYVRLPAR